MDRRQQDNLYEEARGLHGALLRRLSSGYEADLNLRGDLLQDMHVEVWRSLALFDHRCSLRTWVTRVANNVGASHVIRRRRAAGRLVSLEDLDNEIPSRESSTKADSAISAAKLLALIHQLKAVDRQIMLLYLEGDSAGQIAEVSGLSVSNIATKIHRIKRLLSRQFAEGAGHGTPE